ncbi:MAG: hypothetical protein HY099_02030 [Nitrospirae bacterium]|nr:hypothetical protein [Nitrospirota bacterium]
MLDKGSLSSGIKGVVITALIVVCGYGAADVADWKPYAETRYFNFYYDAGDIRYLSKSIFNLFEGKNPKGDISGVWIKRVIKGEKGRDFQIQEQRKHGLSIRGYEQYEYTMALKEINCSDKMYRIISEVDYNKEGGKLGAYTNEPRWVSWRSILPESEDEVLHKALCEETKAEKPGQPAQ